MSTSKSVLRLFTQPLQNTRCYTPPSTSLNAAIRQLHQTSARQSSASPHPLSYQCYSPTSCSVPAWAHPQSTKNTFAPSARLQRRRQHQRSTSTSTSPSSQPSSSASPTSEGNKELPTLSELEQQRTSATPSSSQTIDVSVPKPEYLLQFTCKKCMERSTHKVSKQAYHGGTVLVQCPSCKVRHLVADHLGIFSDQKVTLEDIMAGKGETIRKGRAELNFVPNGEGVMEVQEDTEGAESK